MFPQINQIERGGLAPESSLKQHDFRPGIDIFYSADFGRLRTLAEFEILRGKVPKAGTMERLQIGWLANADTVVWLGRHHTPFGYWNTEYHHGSFLQSAVTRPGIIDFGSGGPLARHLTGLLIESTHTNDDGSALHYSMSVGAGPGVSSGLKEFDILDFNDGKHRLGGILRASYHPDTLASTEAGAFLGYMVIPGNISSIAKVEQAVLGGFGNWGHQRVRLLGELYWIGNQLKRP
ncbi:MAG TPA: hypothetical protein VJM76_00005, partial [Gammaproteobacteria bacterium]|nr:hypothetical protein [Gammaproteobacteria bacterium]